MWCSCLNVYMLNLMHFWLGCAEFIYSNVYIWFLFAADSNEIFNMSALSTAWSGLCAENFGRSTTCFLVGRKRGGNCQGGPCILRNGLGWVSSMLADSSRLHRHLWLCPNWSIVLYNISSTNCGSGSQLHWVLVGNKQILQSQCSWSIS